MYRSACTHSRRCRRSRPPLWDCCRCRSPDCTSRRCGTDRSPCTTSGCRQRKPRPRTYRSACTRSRRCSLSHPPQDSSTCPSSDRTSQPRGTGHWLSTTLDYHRRRPRPRTCRSACTHSHRCRLSRPPLRDCCRCRSPDCTSPRCGTGRSPRTTSGYRQRTPRPRTCRFACTGCRRCSLSRPASRDCCTCRSPGCTSPRCGTGRPPRKPPDCSPYTLPPGSYPSAYTHSRRCRPSRPSSPDSCKDLCWECTLRHHDKSRSASRSPGCSQRKPRIGCTYRFACTGSHRCRLRLVRNRRCHRISPCCRRPQSSSHRRWCLLAGRPRR